MDNEARAAILQEYDEAQDRCLEFTKRLRDLIAQLLEANSVRPHSVSYRLKTKNSLHLKLVDKPGKYGSLDEITDICGIRAITYFEDDVDAVSQIIEDEFEVDFENSVDKRSVLDPDRFGYLSVHYVINLDPKRIGLAEYSEFADLKAEIQIRSILQHAWAEMEHDLGYKAKIEVPRNLQRRFSRLAGLLELADDEFSTIRDELGKYEEEITERVVEETEPVYVDKPSLIAFIQTSDVLTEIDQAIADITGAVIEFSSGYVDQLIGNVLYFDLLTIADVERALDTNRDRVLTFATRWLDGSTQAEFYSGIGLFYLAYSLIASTGSRSQVIRYLDAFNIMGEEEEETQEQIADDILKTHAELTSKD